jgi:hypothetical protein
MIDKTQERGNLIGLGGDGGIPLKCINWEENLRDFD